MLCLWYKRSSVGFGIAPHSRAAGDAFVKHGTGIAPEKAADRIGCTHGQIHIHAAQTVSFRVGELETARVGCF